MTRSVVLRRRAGNGNDSREQRRELLVINGAAHDLERRRGRNHSVGHARAARSPGVTHSGMFPCFFGGSEARLVRSARSARTTWARVSEGAMTASTYPRSAAS